LFSTGFAGRDEDERFTVGNVILKTERQKDRKTERQKDRKTDKL
jgi:hypothetical protein